MPNTPTRLLSLAAVAVALSACGPTLVQLYDGPRQPDEAVTALFSNPHLDLTVDRQYTVPAADRSRLHRIELPVGHHAVEVKCLYTDDVPYERKAGGSAPRDRAYTESPTIALVMDGNAGRRYKPRVHFELGPDGVPGCRAKMFDVTDESGGHKVDLY